MLNHILMEWDHSSSTGQLVLYVAGLACALNARVTILRSATPELANPITPGHITDPLIWYLQEARVDAELEAVVQRFQDWGIQVQEQHSQYTDGLALIRYAQENAITLIVIPNRGRVIGDSAHEIMTYSRTPLLIVRATDVLQETTHSASPIVFRKLLLPLDISQRAEVVLPLATTLAQALNAQLLLTHVVHKPDIPRHAPSDTQDIELAERLIEHNRQVAENYLRGLTTRLNVPTQTQVLISSDVAGTLHAVAEHEAIDLIVLSAHGHSGNPQWPYGAIANHLINYGTKPVLLVQDLPVDMPASSHEMLPAHQRLSWPLLSPAANLYAQHATK